MTAKKLNESTALLTGSSGGIALEMAAQLAEAGVPRIMLNGRTDKTGEAAVAAVKQRAPQADVRFCRADATRSEDAQRLADETMKAFGTIDIVVSSISGHISPKPFHEIPYEGIDHLIHAHLSSVVYTARAVMPHMMEQKSGVIICIASDAAKIATPGEVVVGAAKAGVVMFARTLALEGSRHGIRVHAITPSIVRGTAAYDRAMASEFSRKVFQKAERRARLGVVTPEDMAPLVVFLSGPGASKITGQAISVNGGISAA